MKKTNLWAGIWEKKAVKEKGKSPADISGFSEYYLFRDKIVVQMCDYMSKYLELKKSDSLFEFGCGGCMLLIPFSKKVKGIGGCDISPTMIKHSKSFLPKGKFSVNKTHKVKYVKDESYDKVLCNSVFQYFPSLDYATSVIDELIRICKPGGSILICDIPDAKKINASEFNRKLLNKTDGPGHLYYHKDFFKLLLGGKWKFKMFDNKCLTSNSKFRFNILIKKVKPLAW